MNLGSSQFFCALYFLYMEVTTLFFFNKNVVFPSQAEYSYFSADFRLKIFLYYSWIIAYDIPVLEHIYICAYVLHVPFIEQSLALNILL